ncbi:hypothetical protein [Actinomadura craniellae]|uniref:hypothetical protein n=1 Tax=Actinomadura craniellae TaxID=2231787 RepID=UPI000DD09A34|nr:hypothetical protein [Actinomadura craniellae]
MGADRPAPLDAPDPAGGQAVGRGLMARPDRVRAAARPRSLSDEFVTGFLGGMTWQAALVVLHGLFPGLGLLATVVRKAGELGLDRDREDPTGEAGLEVPARVGEAGLVFDLIARFGSGPVLPALPPAEVLARLVPAAPPDDAVTGWNPYPAAEPPSPTPAAPAPTGVWVIDAAATGLPAPDLAVPTGSPETAVPGAVILADLRNTGTRIVDAAALWWYAARTLARALHDPWRPASRATARRTLREVREVVVIDPSLHLGLCLYLGDDRRPWCLLAFEIAPTAPGDEAVRFLRP